MSNESLDEAGLAALAGVTKKTVYDWLRAKGPLHPALWRERLVIRAGARAIGVDAEHSDSLFGVKGVTEEPPTYIEPMRQVVRRIHGSPEFGEWVTGLLDILESGRPEAVLGIQSNINAFLVSLGKERVSEPSMAGLKRRKKRAG